MIEELRQAVKKDAYDELPESIKASYTREEWLWLSDSQKGNLMRTETEPEWDE